MQEREKGLDFLRLQDVFDQTLEALGPFESNPHLAVATSGGSDSLCLAFLTQDWAHRHRGSLTCLIVDHGLRPESKREAIHTQDLLTAHHIPSALLTWKGEKPLCRIQERAREIRYHLLLQWCHEHQALHLLLGHHRDDQRETFQLRQEKKSGSIGLSGMSALLEMPATRLLRPLLNFSKRHLRDYLKSRDISFIEDPSNLNPQYSRTTLRKTLPTFAKQEQFAKIIREYGFWRIQEEEETNLIVSQGVEISPYGYGVLKKSYYGQLPKKQQLNVLQRCIMTYGAGAYPPRRHSLEKVREKLDRAQTLQGCLIFNDGLRIIFAREPEKTERKPLTEHYQTYRWDERFDIIFSPEINKRFAPLFLGPLAEKGWKHIKETPEGDVLKSVPYPVRLGLPALWEQDQLLYALMPNSSKFTRKKEYAIHFAPRYPLTRFTFTIV